MKWYQYDETQEETSVINQKTNKQIDKTADQNLWEKLGPNFIKKKLSPAANALVCKSLWGLTARERWTLKPSLLVAGRPLISWGGAWGVDLCRAVKPSGSCCVPCQSAGWYMRGQKQRLPAAALLGAGQGSSL